jgi:Ohr subfamily peroxiredoxin
MAASGVFGVPLRFSRRATSAISASHILSRTLRPSQRFLNTDTAPVLYSVTALATGARKGHVEGSEGLKATLTIPKALGGQGDEGTTNAEELFAASYGACFQSAMNLCAKSMGIELPEKAGDSIVETTVCMVGNTQQLDLGVRLAMNVKMRGISKEDLEKVVQKTREVCPYIRSIKGNASVDMTTETM